MSGICHQILAEFFHTIIVHERELEQIKIALADNEHFDIFYSFQCIDKSGNGYIDNKDLRVLFDAHGFKIQKEEVDYLNKNRDGDLKITYKEFMDHLLPTTSCALREKCLNNHYSHKNITLSQSNDVIVEDKIISIYRKRIQYAKALEVFTTYDVEPVDVRDALFDYCEESTGYLDHKKLEGLMQKNSYNLELSDFTAIKRVIGSYWETKLTPTNVVLFMLPDSNLGKNNHIEHKPQPVEPLEDPQRVAFYAERPHLLEKLSRNASPNFKSPVAKTVKFSIVEDRRDGYMEDGNANDTMNTRPSFGYGSGFYSFRSNEKQQPEVYIAENPLNHEDLRNSESKPVAGDYIFESRIGGSSINQAGRISPRNSQGVSDFAVKSSSIHEQAVRRESSKIKNQYDSNLASKRQLLESAKQRRLESSRSIIDDVSVSNKKPGHIVNGMTTINSVYVDNTNRSLNYSLSAKYTYRSDKKSRSPQKKYVNIEDYSSLNSAGLRRSPTRQGLGASQAGLYELRNDENEGPRVIDDTYLNRLNYILDKKEAERDYKSLQVQRTMSFQPTQSPTQTPTLPPNYNQIDQMRNLNLDVYNRTANDYSNTYQNYSTFKQGSPLRYSNGGGLRSSPKRDILFNNEVSVLSSSNLPETMKLGSYRFGNNFYDRMLP